MATPLKIIQISDTHLYADENRILLGVNTEESFQAVIELLEKDTENVDFILHTGDISQDGSSASYIKMAETFKKFKVPVYFVPGNHDHIEILSQVFPRHNVSTERHIVFKKWQFILLSSHVPGAVHGELDKSQLAHLQTCLNAYPEHEAIIVFHHHPMPTESFWLDKSMLKNANVFWEIVAKYPKVNTVLFGHVHQIHDVVVNKVKCVSTPSTCFQFKYKQDKFGLDNLPPGYRRFTFHDDGRIETEVVRVAHYVGKFEDGAMGY